MAEQKSLGQIGWETCWAILARHIPNAVDVKWENLDAVQHDAWNEAASAIVEHNRRRTQCENQFPIPNFAGAPSVAELADSYDKPIHRPAPKFEDTVGIETWAILENPQKPQDP